MNNLKLKASFNDDNFKQLWNNRDTKTMKQQLALLGVYFEYMEIHSVGECVIFYNCYSFNKDTPKFLERIL